VAFIAGVMRSLRSAHRRRHVRARQELAQIRALFAGDAVVLGILDGLGEGLEAEQIRERLGLDSTAYDTARRRMRRALLREGLASCLDK
jgi:RNA polymerase sigma-70 factor (ECF subfamily)